MQSNRNHWALWICTSALALCIALTGALSVFVAHALTAILTILCLPVFRRYALARPNARSSHRVPIPQGGGAAIILVLIGMVLLHLPHGAGRPFALALVAATGILAGLGAWDDIKPLPAGLRLAVQATIAIMICMLMPPGWRILPMLPEILERGVLALGLVWFINLTNFMDGIDGITVVGIVPMSLFIGYVLIGDQLVEIAAFSLAGALLAFLIFNWHPARLFLGDVGSLPIGLLAGVFLIALAAQMSLTAALVLPLYHVMDATSTLLIRLWRREKVWEAHRQHAYQHAVDAGLSHTQVSGMILALNMLLCVLAAVAVYRPDLLHPVLLMAVAASLTVALIAWFRTRKT